MEENKTEERDWERDTKLADWGRMNDLQRKLVDCGEYVITSDNRIVPASLARRGVKSGYRRYPRFR